MEDNEDGRSFSEYKTLALKIEREESSEEIEAEYW